GNDFARGDRRDAQNAPFNLAAHGPSLRNRRRVRQARKEYTGSAKAVKRLGASPHYSDEEFAPGPPRQAAFDQQERFRHPPRLSEPFPFAKLQNQRGVAA